MWLPSKSRSSKLQGAQAVRVAKLWERWAAGAPLHLSASSPALLLLRQVLSDHLLIHQPLYLCTPYHTSSVVHFNSCEESWKSSWIFYAEHPPPAHSLRDVVGAKQMARTIQQTPEQAKGGCLPFHPPPLEKQCPALPSEKFAFSVKMVHFVYKSEAKEKCYVAIFKDFFRKVQLPSEWGG